MSGFGPVTLIGNERARPHRPSASRLLTNPNIQARVQEIVEAGTAKAKITGSYMPDPDHGQCRKLEYIVLVDSPGTMAQTPQDLNPLGPYIPQHGRTDCYIGAPPQA
jgi:hypothetical protein